MFVIFCIIVYLVMIPRKSKKKLEATIEEIRKFSFSYLEKYAPSKQQLRTYLLKKFFNSLKFLCCKKRIIKSGRSGYF